MTDDITHTNATFQAWMLGNLGQASDLFGVQAAGQPRWGWNLRSVSALVTGPAGTTWLRVGSERVADVEEQPDFWTGIPDSVAIAGAAIPRVLRSTEWPATEHGRRVRADLMTILPGQPCSPTDVLCSMPDVADSWWDQLAASLAVVSATPTTRFAAPAQPHWRVRAVFGVDVARALALRSLATVHGDLHWANILCPTLGLLDWELWGRGPVGLDPATLWVFSLRVPEVAQRVWDTFGDILDSPDGRAALVTVASRILYRASDYPDLAPLVTARIRPWVERAAVG